MTDALRDTLRKALGTTYRVERERGGGGQRLAALEKTDAPKTKAVPR